MILQKRSRHFARSNSYAKFVSFEFRNNRLSIKTKARQLHKQNIFRLRVTENFQTRTESEQKSQLPKQSWKNEDHEKKEKQETEREKKNIRHVCGKGNLSQCHASQDLTMEDRKQTFLHLKIKHKQVGDSQWQLQLGTQLSRQIASLLGAELRICLKNIHTSQQNIKVVSQLASLDSEKIVVMLPIQLQNFSGGIVAKYFYKLQQFQNAFVKLVNLLLKVYQFS